MSTVARTAMAVYNFKRLSSKFTRLHPLPVNLHCCHSVCWEVSRGDDLRQDGMTPIRMSVADYLSCFCFWERGERRGEREWEGEKCMVWEGVTKRV